MFSPIANKSEWLPQNALNHRAIEWRDIVLNKTSLNTHSSDTAIKIAEPDYYPLFYSIKTFDVVPLIDELWAAIKQ